MAFSITSIIDKISEALDPEMERLINSLSSGEGEFIHLPTDTDGLSQQEVSRLIALASNKYGYAVRLASFARAKAKIAEARYKAKYRVGLAIGKNKEEREANAMGSASQEHQEMILAQALVELCESLESAARITSESARKMLGAVEQGQVADHRFSQNASSLQERDFSHF